MLKHLKSVGMLLFLSTISGGAVYASSGERVTGIDAVQQNGTCTGVVKDGTGETVIGASVVVRKYQRYHYRYRWRLYLEQRSQRKYIGDFFCRI